MKQTLYSTLAGLIVLFLSAPAVRAVGERIDWKATSGGGGLTSSASYRLQSTIGQTAAGPVAGTTYRMNTGYQQNFFPLECCVGIRGNANGSGGVTISDLSQIVNFLFRGGDPSDCPDEANVNGIGGVTISDVTYLVQFLFQGGPEPPDCP